LSQIVASVLSGFNLTFPRHLGKAFCTVAPDEFSARSTGCDSALDLRSLTPHEATYQCIISVRCARTLLIAATGYSECRYQKRRAQLSKNSAWLFSPLHIFSFCCSAFCIDSLPRCLGKVIPEIWDTVARNGKLGRQYSRQVVSLIMSG
jgi:hypothetical protein